MKHILNIYYQGGVMHMKFFWGVNSIAELLPFDWLNFNDFFCPQPLLGNQWMFYETYTEII